MELPKTTKLQRLHMTLKTTFKVLKNRLNIKSINDTSIIDIKAETDYVPLFIKYSSYLMFIRIDVYAKFPTYVDKVEEWCDTDELHSFISWMDQEHLYIIDVNDYINMLNVDDKIYNLHRDILSLCPKFCNYIDTSLVKVSN
jgi:hypothetical protein